MKDNSLIHWTQHYGRYQTVSTQTENTSSGWLPDLQWCMLWYNEHKCTLVYGPITIHQHCILTIIARHNMQMNTNSNQTAHHHSPSSSGSMGLHWNGCALTINPIQRTQRVHVHSRIILLEGRQYNIQHNTIQWWTVPNSQWIQSKTDARLGAVRVIGWGVWSIKYYVQWSDCL